MIELFLCLFALVLGPVLYQLSRARRNTYAFFDGFVLVGVGGLVLIEILPRTFQALGIGVLPVAIAGFIFPHVLEHWLDSLPVSPRTILSGLIILGLAIHQLLDGAALHAAEAAGEENPLSALGIAVILHQLPKGFLLWDLARKARGTAAAVLVIAGLLAATSAGAFLGKRVLLLLEQDIVLYFQAFVAGGLLHVAVHHVSSGAEGRPRSGPAISSGIGALAALGLIAWMPHAHFLEPILEAERDARDAFLRLFVASAPPVLIGFFFAGVIQAFVPTGNLRWFRGRNRLSEALRGIAIGLPLPICSCGVTPIYHTLIRRGVPAAAAVSLLIATPEIGVDSLFLSGRLLGWKITFIRLGMAFLVAVLTGCLLSGLYGKALDSPEAPAEPLKSDVESRSFREKLRLTFAFGFGELVDHVGVWLVAGIALAAIVEPYVDPRWFTSLPAGLDIILLALAGLPVYVCASGATPLAAALLGKGVSAGAILAFLITGPATNFTTIGVLSRLHGVARASALPAAVFLLSVLLGFGVNQVLGPPGAAAVEAEGEAPAGTVDAACAVLLALILAGSVLRLGPRRFIGRLASDSGLPEESPEGPGDHAGHRH